MQMSLMKNIMHANEHVSLSDDGYDRVAAVQLLAKAKAKRASI
jgi:hypothetical protein